MKYTLFFLLLALTPVSHADDNSTPVSGSLRDISVAMHCVKTTEGGDYQKVYGVLLELSDGYNGFLPIDGSTHSDYIYAAIWQAWTNGGGRVTMLSEPYGSLQRHCRPELQYEIRLITGVYVVPKKPSEVKIVE